MALDNTFLRDALENVNRINGNETLLDMLLEFEKVLDDVGVYAYKNWMLGEVVEGPLLERYWFNVTLMYPRTEMPDPDAMRRLDKYGCKVQYVKEQIDIPVKVRGPEDLKDLKTKAIDTVMEAGTPEILIISLNQVSKKIGMQWNTYIKALPNVH